MEARTFQYYAAGSESSRVLATQGVDRRRRRYHALGTLANLPMVGQRGLLRNERHKLTGHRFDSL
jgi:hypothetical protein